MKDDIRGTTPNLLSWLKRTFFLVLIELVGQLLRKIEKTTHDLFLTDKASLKQVLFVRIRAAN
jgi:hypothetical protein